VTLPRNIVPASTYIISRRTSERRFFLRPDQTVNQVMAYCCARAARKHDISLHSLDVLSNHEHCVLTDNQGLLPEFLHDYHHHSACCLNEYYDRQENLWDNSQTSIVRLVTNTAVINQICYAQINTVKAALVRYRDQWPGIHFGPKNWLSEPTVIKRPELFFNASDDGLEQVEIDFSIPQMLLDGRLPIEIVRELNRFIDDQERAVRRDIIQQGRSFWGPKKVLQIRSFDRPKSKAPKGKLNPRVAASDPEQLKEAIKQDKIFLQEHRTNRLLWQQSLEHCMPQGTFWLRYHSNAVCAPFDPG
jgi:putative transposase